MIAKTEPGERLTDLTHYAELRQMVARLRGQVGMSRPLRASRGHIIRLRAPQRAAPPRNAPPPGPT